jgi:integrase
MPKRRPNGAGSIVLRKDGRYMGRAYVLTDAGFRERVTVYGKTWDEVDAELGSLKANDREGIAKVTATTKFGDYLEYWLSDVVAKEQSPGTYANYASLARRHIIPKLGTRTLQKLSVKDVRGFVASMRGSTTTRKAPMSDRTIQLLYTVVSSALSNAVREELVTRNVARLVRTPYAERAETTPLDQAELAAFLSVAMAHRMRALWIIYLSLGLRRCEGLGLAWEDIDFAEKVVHVRYQLQRIKGSGLMRVRLKSKKSRRVLPLPTVCAQALRAWQLVQHADETAVGQNWAGNAQGLVFTTRFGRPIEPSTINRSLNVLAERAQLRALHPHALRHSCATFLKSAGVDLLVIRDILGHSQISVTADIYTHVLRPDLRAAVARLDGLMSTDANDTAQAPVVAPQT